MIGVRNFINNLSSVQKIIYSILILGLILIISIGVPTLARYKNRHTIINAPVWDGSVANSYRRGTGTEEDPYIISNGSELAYLASQLPSEDYSDTYFALSNDIVLNDGIFKYDLDNGIQYTINGQLYYIDEYSNQYYDNIDRIGTEIGTVNIFDSLNGFKGNFDGKSFTIYGLYITNENDDELALFTSLEGNVKDLYVENSLIYGGTITGGIASTSNNNSIKNVLFDGYVIGKNTDLTKESNINPISSLINVEDTETISYINLTNNIPFTGAQIISTRLTGNYTINGSNETETTIKINDTVVTGGSFEIDLGNNILSSILVLTITSSSGDVTITFSNLNYHVTYNYAISSGIVARGYNTEIINTINKADVYGYSVSGGLIGITTDLISINQSYNTGNITSDTVSGGLVGVIEKNGNNIIISKSYNSGDITAPSSGGLVGIIDNNTGTISLNDVFDASTTYSIDTVNNTVVSVENAYFIKEGKAINNGEASDDFISVSLTDLQSKDYVVTNLFFDEFISFDDLENHDSNVWIYEQDSLPILFIDDLNKPIANIHAGIYTWNNLSMELNPIRFSSNITFSIEEVDELRPLQKYYYVSDSVDPLSKDDILEIDSWMSYDNIVQITEEGVYVIYVKVVEYDDEEEENVTYLNTDLLILDSTGPTARAKMGDYSWSDLQINLNYTYINKTKNITIEVDEDISGVSSIDYYLTNEILNTEALENINDWTTYSDEILIDEIGTHIVYFKLVDNFGYTTYLNTDYIVYGGYQLNTLTIGRNSLSYVDAEPYISNNSIVTLDFSYTNNLEILDDHTHNLITNILLPLGTKITLIDRVTNKVYNYQITTSEDIYNYNDSCDIEDLECKKRATYPFTLFKEIGTINNFFVENSYYNEGATNENFTIVFDFSRTNINNNYTDVIAYLELHNSNGESVRPTLYDTLKKLNIYSSVNGEDAKAKLSITTNYDGSEIIYNSNSTTNIDLTSKINYQYINDFRIVDTTYEDKEIGLAIKLVDENGNIVNKKHLKNIIFQIDEKRYYLENDNIVRINLESGIANITKTLTVITQNDNTTLEEGTYYLKISNYASHGYYDELSEEEISIPVIVAKNTSNIPHGFDVIMDDSNRIVSKENENLEVLFKVLQSSSLDNPNIRVSLYKKDLVTAYNQDYSVVDLSNYVSNNLNMATENVYYVSTNPIQYDGTINTYNNFVLNLITVNFENTGYKFVFTLYDGDIKIGTIEKYFIVK